VTEGTSLQQSVF